MANYGSANHPPLNGDANGKVFIAMASLDELITHTGIREFVTQNLTSRE